MAPELHGFATKPNAATGQAKVAIDPFASDMWSLGEISYRMLTKRPAFPSLSNLFLYAQGSQDFPISVLSEYKVSTNGQQFILSTMQVSSSYRITASQAWKHEWLAQHKASYLSPRSFTIAKYECLF